MSLTLATLGFARAGSQEDRGTRQFIEKLVGYPWFDKAMANVIANRAVPASAAAAGVPGEIAIDASFIYVCVGASVWKRVAIATW